MKVILDTNVLLGALISPYGPPDKIYHAWCDGQFDLVTSEEQLDELRRVSRYPKLKTILPAHRIGTLINHMQRSIVLDSFMALPSGIQINDPNDIFLVSMALSAEADYLVTGDRRAGLLAIGHIGRTRILSPACFCEEILS
jgi:putative PIN family toxin of toxin-antitoxin system